MSIEINRYTLYQQEQEKIYNECTYTQIITKKKILFFFTVYKNEWKQNKF